MSTEVEQCERDIQELTDHLELIKADLKWQLSFEEIDWDHFGEFVKSAKVLRDKIEELKLQSLENEEKETLAETNRRQAEACSPETLSRESRMNRRQMVIGSRID